MSTEIHVTASSDKQTSNAITDFAHYATDFADEIFLRFSYPYLMNAFNTFGIVENLDNRCTIMVCKTRIEMDKN